MSSLRGAESAGRAQRFADNLLYRAARLYYLEDATQADIAELLGVSRPSVSRMLSEARQLGIVSIEVRDPAAGQSAELAERVAKLLGLERVWVTPRTMGVQIGHVLAPATAEAIAEAGLQPGDALLVSSGATTYEISGECDYPLPGVLMGPTVGGMEEPEAYYQTNEITRRWAVSAKAIPVMLYAPALPGPNLHEMLLQEPSIQRVLQMWKTARCAVIGIGAPPKLRTSLPSVMALDNASMQAAVADISTRPIDANGNALQFPGSDRLFAMDLEDVRRVPYSIGVAVGVNKIGGIAVAARSGYINRLVTDAETAAALLAEEVSAA